jgi:DNA-binding response OmpR family regulator
MGFPLSLVLIEDNGPLRRVLTRLLENEGFRVHAYGCVEDFDDDLQLELVDLFLLDVQLPGESGLSLCQRLRQHHPRAGIAILSGRDSREEIALGYLSGADVYLPKPLHAEALLAAITNLAHRVEPNHALSDTPVLRLDPYRSILQGPSDQIHLNLTQYQLVLALARAPNQKLETWKIVELFGLNPLKDNKLVVEQRLSRLRRKLAAVGCTPAALQVCYGEGYRLTVPIRLV